VFPDDWGVSVPMLSSNSLHCFFFQGLNHHHGQFVGHVLLGGINWNTGYAEFNFICFSLYINAVANCIG